MNEYINIAIVAAMTTWLIDVSGFTQSWTGAMSKWLGAKVSSVKPFTCSLCMTHHVCLIYAICAGAFSLKVWAYICALAFLTKPFGMLLHALLYFAEQAIETINKLTDKIARL